MAENKASKAALTRSFAPGELIFRDGDFGNEMFVVRKGAVRIFKQTGDTELTLAVLNAGEGFGEMAILEQSARSASAMAVGETELVVVHEEAFEQMLTDRPDIAVRFLKKLSARLREANRQIQLLTTHGGAARVVQILKMWTPVDAEGEVKLSGVKPEELWRASGTPREVFGEVLHRLGEAGVARFSGQGLHIALPRGLDEFLEYLDLKRTFDATTTQELAALRQIHAAVVPAAKDGDQVVAGSVGPKPQRRETYQRFLALQQQFEK